jgi:lipid-A-disaccharide synthase-like uncharacterized protein
MLFTWKMSQELGVGSTVFLAIKIFWADEIFVLTDASQLFNSIFFLLAHDLANSVH